MRWQGAFLLPVLCIPPTAPAADTDPGMPGEFDWQANVRAGYYSRPNELDGDRNVLSGSLWLRLASRFGNGSSMLVDGVARRDESSRSDGSTHHRLREAYLSLGTEDTDVRVGKQIIAWGRADRLNPTDNLTPHDYTWLSANDDDQRTGAWSARVTWHPRACAVSGVWLMRLAPAVLPIAPIPGVHLTEDVPHSMAQGALKIDCSGGAVDGSLSYFNGLDVNPDLRIGAARPSGVELVLAHQRIKVLGLDAATAVGRYGLRAEAAYAWTASSATPDDTTKRPYLYLVAGGDRSFDSGMNINLQYYVRHVAHYRDPDLIVDPLVRTVALKNAAYAGQTLRTDQGLAFRVSRAWMADTLNAELRGQFSSRQENYALRGRLSYAFDDHFKGTVGMNLYRGAPDTLFNEFRAMSAVMVELRYDF